MSYQTLINSLLSVNNPSIQWKVRIHILNENRHSRVVQALEIAIKHSKIVRLLLQNVNEVGQIVSPKGVYDKWQGAHWILATLADIGYPRGDTTLAPVREQVLNCWLQPRFYHEFEATKKADAYKKKNAIPVMQGRHRTCASQQGYTLYYLLKLGLETKRIHDLAERIMYWQWPDGGWNCDKNPDAKKSTFIHTLHCMRGLALYAQQTGDSHAWNCALKAAEVFLSRRLFKRLSDGTIIKKEFTMLHYPLYWHYDILLALKAFAEMNLINDERCKDALDLLENKHLSTGGWPAESRYYKVSPQFALNADYVNWGGTSKKRMNEWVTVDALYVLKQAGRVKQ